MKKLTFLRPQCRYLLWACYVIEYLYIVHFTSNSTEYKLNFSDMLQSLVGQQNARHGIIKIFNALQETRANKHLLYVSHVKPTRGLTVSLILHFYSHIRVIEILYILSHWHYLSLWTHFLCFLFVCLPIKCG